MAAELKQSRTTAKCLVTKLSQQILRYIHEGEEDEVSKRVALLKKQFVSFDHAHENYTEAVGVDNEENDMYYDEVLSGYMRSLSAANAWHKELNAESKDDDISIVRLLTLPKIEIEKFSGDPQHYLSFCSVFDEAVDSVADKDKVKLTRLLQFTTGDAHEAIRSCSLISGDEGYREARAILKKRFGSDHLISERTIRDLIGGSVARSPLLLQKLGDAAANAERILRSLNQLAELNSQQTITAVVERLPTYIKNDWRKQATRMKRKEGRYPNFSELVCFLQDVADDANDPVYGTTPKPDNNVKGFSSVMNEPAYRASSPPRMTIKCVLCGADHKLFHCKQFKDMSPRERKQLVLNKSLCENCLLSNHSTQDCRKNSICSVPGCGEKHTRFIHVNNSGITCQANMDVDNNIAMPIVAVNINNMYVGNALLDTASSNSFITRATVDKLGIIGTPVEYNLSTLIGNQTAASEAVSIQLTSSSGSDKITLHNVYVIDNIPVKTFSYNVNAYEHLCDLPFAETKPGQPVNVLIGQDCAEALIPLEMRRGTKGAPFATRTLFGWSLNGPTSIQRTPTNCVIGNLMTTSFRKINLENDISNSTVEMSPNDSKVLIMPDNFALAKHCLLSTETLKNKDPLKEYDSEIKKFINKKYAEPVPQTDAETSDLKIFYLPHHAVIKRTGKMRAVSDSSHSLDIEGNMKKDSLSCKAGSHDVITKRCILSLVTGIIDPLGLIWLIIVFGKMLFQHAILLKMKWDEKLADQHNAWLFARCEPTLEMKNGPEVRKEVQSRLERVPAHPIKMLCHSGWHRLKRALAWLMRIGKLISLLSQPIYICAKTILYGQSV